MAANNRKEKFQEMFGFLGAWMDAARGFDRVFYCRLKDVLGEGEVLSDDEGFRTEEQSNIQEAKT